MMFNMKTTRSKSTTKPLNVCEACCLPTTKPLTEVEPVPGEKIMICTHCLNYDQESEDLAGSREL